MVFFEAHLYLLDYLAGMHCRLLSRHACNRFENIFYSQEILSIYCAVAPNRFENFAQK